MRAQILVGAFAAVLCSSAAIVAQAPVSTTTPTCVILKRASAGAHAWQGIEFYYVEGTYPSGMKFHTNLRGRHVRDIVKKGGKFVVVEPNYTVADLERAQRECKPGEAPETPGDAPNK